MNDDYSIGHTKPTRQGYLLLLLLLLEGTTEGDAQQAQSMTMFSH